MITWHFRAEWYAHAPRLEVLATPAAGRELVAWRAAPENVKVHFGAFHGEIIAESVLAYCMGWARGFFRPVPASGMWPRKWLGGCCFMLEGTKAVIAGYGKIGKAIGRRLEASGVGVRGFGRSGIAQMEEAMREADWFIMALPGDTGTDGFLDTRRLALLKPSCVVVNIGRGNAIDEDALAAALSSGRIAAAYLDVFRDEPTQLAAAAGCTGLASDKARAALPTLTAMPHSSAFAPDYIARCFKELHDEGLLPSRQR